MVTDDRLFRARGLGCSARWQGGGLSWITVGGGRTCSTGLGHEGQLALNSPHPAEDVARSSNESVSSLPIDLSLRLEQRSSLEASDVGGEFLHAHVRQLEFSLSLLPPCELDVALILYNALEPRLLVQLPGRDALGGAGSLLIVVQQNGEGEEWSEDDRETDYRRPPHDLARLLVHGE